jgi:hypothetical protein
MPRVWLFWVEWGVVSEDASQRRSLGLFGPAGSVLSGRKMAAKRDRSPDVVPVSLSDVNDEGNTKW